MEEHTWEHHWDLSDHILQLEDAINMIQGLGLGM